MTFTAEDVLQVLEKVVAKKGGDFVYIAPKEGGGECAYTKKDGAPSCIVGYVLKELDPDLLTQIHEQEWEYIEDDTDWEGQQSHWTINANSAVDILPEDEFAFLAIQGLNRAQLTQDQSGTWSEALEEYKKKVGL